MGIRKQIVLSLALALGTLVVSATGAGASVSPTTGQPGAPAGVTCGSGNAASTPGLSASAPGSAFNPGGAAGGVYAGNFGTASLAHSNSSATVSEYDVACLQVTSH